MVKSKILFMFVVLCLILSTVLFAEEQSEGAASYVKIVRSGDENKMRVIEDDFAEDGLSIVEYKPYNKENANSSTDKRALHILRLFFNESPLCVMIYNNTNYYDDSGITWASDHTEGRLSVSEGTYDVMAHFFRAPDHIFKIIVKEGVVINSDVNLNIETTDAVYDVNLSHLNENGNPIALEDETLSKFIFRIKTPMQTVPMTFANISANPGNISNVIKHSQVSEDYGFRVIQLKGVEGKVFEIAYEEYYGVSCDCDVINDPSDYRHSPAKFSFNPSAETHYLCAGITFFEGTTAVSYTPRTNSYPIGGNAVIDVYVSNVIGDSSRGACFAFPLAVFSEATPNYFTLFTPFYFLTEIDRKIACSLRLSPANNDIVVNNGESIDFNMTLPRLYKTFGNNGGGQPCIGGLGQYFTVYGSENQDFDVDKMNSNYHVTHNGDIIDSGILESFEGLYGLLSDTYSFIVDYDSYYIKDIQGTAEFNLTFDLGADDPNSPSLTSLKIKNENGETVTSLPQNGNGTIELTAKDKFITHYEIDSVKVYYKDHNENDWRVLPVNEEPGLSDPNGGQYFMGEISSITTQYTNGTYVDLKIRITDETGNSNQQIWQPALYVSEQISVDDPAEHTHSTIISSIGPNPFNNHTTIHFSLAKSSLVRMDVYNVRGEKVRTLVDDELAADTHIVTWDGKDTFGKKVSSGIYFCRINTDEATETKKMMFVH